MKIYILIILLICTSCSSKEQQIENSDIVGKISKILIEKYVDKDIAVNISNKILENQKLGKYDSLYDAALLSTINLDIHSVHNDRHIQLVNNKLANKKLPWNKSFILDVKILDGNIGYLRFSHFPEPNKEVFKKIASAFDLLENTTGIIIDLTGNGGGHPDVVSNILGYFLEDAKEYDKFYVPSEKKTFKYTSHKRVIGTKLINKPLKVIVNKKTASSGELLAFAIQNLKIGKVYGSPTMGLVNLSEYFPINDSISLLASKGRQENPFKKQGLENVGVTPDFLFDENRSLLEAHLDHIESTHGFQTREWISNKLETMQFQINPNLLNEYIGSYQTFTISKKDETLFYQGTNGFEYEMTALNDSTFSLKTNYDDRFRLIFEKEEGTIALIKKYFDGTEERILKSNVYKH